jgi:hypothetical protein
MLVLRPALLEDRSGQNNTKSGYVFVGYGLDATDVHLLNQFKLVPHSLHRSSTKQKIKNSF